MLARVLEPRDEFETFLYLSQGEGGPLVCHENSGLQGTLNLVNAFEVLNSEAAGLECLTYLTTVITLRHLLPKLACGANETDDESVDEDLKKRTSRSISISVLLQVNFSGTSQGLTHSIPISITRDTFKCEVDNVPEEFLKEFLELTIDRKVNFLGIAFPTSGSWCSLLTQRSATKLF